MKEDTIDDLKRRVSDLEKNVAALERNAKYTSRVIQVLIAVGHLSQEKLEQAREIVSSLAD